MNSIDVTIRKTNTKGEINSLRTKGSIPAIIYGGKNENQKISISKKTLKVLIDKENFLSNILSITIDGKPENVLPKEIVWDPITDEPIHIDFLRIVAGSKINLEIPVKFVNQDKSPGLKRGGVLNIVRRKVELTCPTENIPKEIIVDLDNLDIGSSIKISFVKLPENVKPTIIDRDFVIATVAAPTVVKEPEKPAETSEGEVATAEAGSEGAAEGGDEKAKTASDTEKPKEKDGDKKDDKKTSSDKK